MRVLLYWVTALLIADVAAEDGQIQDFHQTYSEGDEVGLMWHMTPSTNSTLRFYNLYVDGDYEKNVDCDASYCSINVIHLQGCQTYTFKLVPQFTATGEDGYPIYYEGDPAETEGSTAIIPPEAPRNVRVTETTTDTITVSWEDPTKNSLCSFRYMFSYVEEDQTRQMHLLSTKNMHFAVIGPVKSCTRYQIRVYALNQNGIAGDNRTIYAETEEVAPSPVRNLYMKPTGLTSLNVFWESDPEDNCAGTAQICFKWEHFPDVTCEVMDVSGDNGHHNYTVNGQYHCSECGVQMTLFSPKEYYKSPSVEASGRSEDHAPGPVTNLKVSNVSGHSLTVEYDPPKEFPYCVKEYELQVQEANVSTNASLHTYLTSQDTSVDVNGLMACTHYLISVRSVSQTDLRSPWKEVTVVTFDDRPSDPRYYTLTDVTKHSVTLNWMEPLRNPRCVTHYTVEWDDYENDIVGSVTVSEGPNFPTDMHHTLHNLTSCTFYFFTVSSGSATAGSSDGTDLIKKTDC